MKGGALGYEATLLFVLPLMLSLLFMTCVPDSHTAQTEMGSQLLLLITAIFDTRLA